MTEQSYYTQIFRLRRILDSAEEMFEKSPKASPATFFFAMHLSKAELDIGAIIRQLNHASVDDSDLQQIGILLCLKERIKEVRKLVPRT